VCYTICCSYPRSHSESFLFFFYCYRHPPDLHSFPTRRSSDLTRRDPLQSSGRFHRGQSRPTRRESRSLRTVGPAPLRFRGWARRSEEHTSELQSRGHLVCRLLLEKKKNIKRDCHENDGGRALS